MRNKGKRTAPRRTKTQQRRPRRSASAPSRGNTRQADSTALVRINKFIADAGLTSRRKADELLKSGVVKVNGKTVTDLATRVHPGDMVTVNGDPVGEAERFQYYLLNKPKDYITTTSDEKGRRTVMELVPTNARIYPVGRLDRNTTGVLLFTNDGDMAHKLMHPSNKVMREYRVGLDKPIEGKHLAMLMKGVQLEDGMAKAVVAMANPQDERDVVMSITEGRNREVRRMFESLGYFVKKLDRRIFANLTTRGLRRGDHRSLTKDEIRELEKALGLERKREKPTTQTRGRKRR